MYPLALDNYRTVGLICDDLRSLESTARAEMNLRVVYWHLRVLYHFLYCF